MTHEINLKCTDDKFWSFLDRLLAKKCLEEDSILIIGLEIHQLRSINKFPLHVLLSKDGTMNNMLQKDFGSKGSETYTFLQCFSITGDGPIS